MSSAMFRVVAPMGVTLPTGTRVLLSADQARPRRHAIDDVEVSDGQGLFQVRDSVMFKRGEVIGFPPEAIDKIALAALEPAGEATEAHDAAVKGSPARKTPPRKAKAAKE